MIRLPALLAVVCIASVAGTHAAQPGTAAPAPVAAPARAAPGGASTPRGSIGRLFFSPAERAQLDVARLQRKAPTPAAPVAVEAPPAPEIVTYGGLVRRSDGRQMLWLNNRLVDAKEGLAGLSLRGSVKPDGAVTLQSQSGAMVDLKVGQSVEVSSGKVVEARKPTAAKPAPDAMAPPEDAKAAAAPEAKPTEGKPPAAAVKPPAPETAEKKPPPGGTGLKMDLGGRAPSGGEAERFSSSK